MRRQQRDYARLTTPSGREHVGRRRCIHRPGNQFVGWHFVTIRFSGECYELVESLALIRRADGSGDWRKSTYSTLTAGSASK